MPGISAFRKAILRLHGCDSKHIETVHVHDEFKGRTVWEGTVEVFALRDHQTAKRCYVWSHAEDDGGERFFAVLEVPPIDSALQAVKAAIAADGKLKPWESSDGFA
jgi:hypothetical protein